MEPIATMSASPGPAPGHESAALRARGLAAARRRATALLAGVTVLFLAVTAVGVHGILLGYVQAGAEASMVGGVADWFAVTALFRHPLGLPIPHTALIVERKDQFAATLGQFVQENFLNADVLAERIGSARLVPRLAAWLADQANAARFAGHAADLAVTAAEALRDEDVQRVLTAELTRAAGAVEVAPLAGRALRVIIAGGHHAELFNAIVSGADRYLADHYPELRDLFEAESPRWVPDAVYRRVFDRLYTRLRQRLAAAAADPDDQALSCSTASRGAGLASERVTEQGEDGETDCPGPLVLQYGPGVRHGYPGPASQFGKRHAPLREQLVKTTGHAVLRAPGQRLHMSDEPFRVLGAVARRVRNYAAPGRNRSGIPRAQCGP